MKSHLLRRRTAASSLAYLLLAFSLILTMFSVPANSAPVPDPDPNQLRVSAWLDLDADGVNDPDEPSANHLVTAQVFNGDDTAATGTGNQLPLSTWLSADFAPFKVRLNITGGSLGPAGPDQAATQSGDDIEITGAQVGNVYQVGVVPSWSVSLGRYGGGVIDGQPPFATDPDSVCPGNPQPGDDCAANDGIIRGGNTIGYRWAVSANKTNPTDTSTLSKVFLVQNVVPQPGVELGTGDLPSACDIYGSSLQRLPDGSIRLICDLGEWTESGTTKLFRWNMRVIGGTHGREINSTAYVTAGRDLNDLSNPGDPQNPTPNHTLVAPSDPITDTSVLSAGFKYDLNKVRSWSYSGQYRDINGERLRGSLINFLVGLSSPITSNSLPDGDLTFVDDIFFSADGDANSPSPVGDIEHYLVECGASGSWSNLIPFGFRSNDGRGVQNSGRCELNRQGNDNTSPYSVTLRDIQFGGPYPTKMADGSGDLTNGPYYSAAYQITVFVPDRAVSSIDDPVGSPSMDAVAVYNRVADFDPVSQSGQVNYGGDREPGWCDETIDPYTDDFSNAGCNQMPGGSPSNNLAAGAATVVPPAHHVPGVSKYFVQSTNQQLFPGSQYAGDGQGRISAGEGAYSQLNMWVGDSYGWKNYGICDVWDNSTMKLVPAQSLNNDAAPGTYATLQGYNIPGQYNGNQPNWIFQYGHFDTTGVDPFYNSALVAVTENSPTWPTTNTYNTNEQRFWGDWSALKSAANDCRQTNPSAGWFSDPNDVPGGIDEVNAVRIIAADPSLLVTEENPASFSFRIPLRARSQFYGGPNDGTAIPADVIVPNYSSVWGQNDNDDWHEPGSQFEPAPFSYGGYGDRVTFTRGSLSHWLGPVTVDEDNHSQPTNATTPAGRKIIWESRPGIAQGNGEVENMVVTQTLPEGVTYDAVCTAGIADQDPTNWTPAPTPSVSTDFLGRTVLTWQLGNRPAGAQRDPKLRVCVTTDPLAPDNTELQTTSTVSGDGIPSVTRTSTMTLVQTNELGLGKYVSMSATDVQDYTLRVKNFSDATDFDSPKFIEVFPYNGDATSPDGINRGVGSEFSGSVSLVNEPVATWSSDPSTPQVAGEFSYSADPPASINQKWAQNTSTWCTLSGSTFTRIAGTGSCPTDLSEVTALRFEASENLLKASEAGGTRTTMSVDFSLMMVGYQSADRYHDKFTLVTPTITTQSGSLMTLESNTTLVHTPGFTVGNLVFVDLNANDKYESGVDALVPGVNVEVWSAGNDGSIGNGDDYQIGTAITNQSGAWKVGKVAPGSIYARIPASEFQSGGPLHGATPVGAGQPFADDNIAQDGVADGSGGVITAVHELSYVTNPDFTTTGNAPLGERRHGLTLTQPDDYTDLTIDFGFTGNSSLSGVVWNDLDLNGSLDGSESGTTWDRVIIQQLDSNDQVVATIRTGADSAGAWQVSNLLPGRYRVQLGSMGLDATPFNVVSTYDSDGTSTPHAAIVDLGGEEDRTGIDFGIGIGFQIYGNIFKDTALDGMFSWSKPSRTGVAVNLRAEDGTLVRSTTSNSSGYYEFNSVPAGSYYVEIPATEFEVGGSLAGMTPTTAPGNSPWYAQLENVGSLQVDGSTASPVRRLDTTFQSDGSTLGDVPLSTSWNFGFISSNPASASGLVWNDLNGNGALDPGEPGLGNSQVTLFQPSYHPDNGWTWNNYQSVTTDSEGYWSVTGLEEGEWAMYVSPSGNNMYSTHEPTPRGAHGNTSFTVSGGEHRSGLDFGFATAGTVDGTVWADYNRNGIQDPGEFGLEGVSVQICQGNPGDGSHWCSGASTTSNGSWTIGWIPPGTYTVTVQSDQLPAGHHYPTYDIDGVDSPNQVELEVTSSGVSGIDFGYTRVAEFGDRIWNDANHNGVDDGENGLEGVTVELRRVADDSVAHTTTTNWDGRYHLLADEPGNYYIAIPASEFAIGNPLAPTEPTVNSVADPSDGVDLDNNGYAMTGGGIRTGEVTAAFDGDGLGITDDSSIDLGLWVDPEAAKPRLLVEKFTQGLAGESSPGVPVKPGDPVKWTYKVTNVGDGPIEVEDFYDDKVGPLFSEDDQGNEVLNYVFEDISQVQDDFSPGEYAILSYTGVATEGPYENTITVIAANQWTTDISNAAVISDTSHYTGVRQGVDVETRVNGQLVADPATGPEVPTGSTLTWTFEVTNTGNYPGVFTVTNPFVPDAQIVCDLSGTNEVALRAGESDVCRATSIAASGTQQTTTTAVEDGITTYDAAGQQVPNDPTTATDQSGYRGVDPAPNPGITVRTLINGSEGTGVSVPAGSTMTISHTVTNTGNTHLTGVTLSNNGNPVACPKSKLAPSESMVCTERVPAPVDGQTYLSSSAAQGTPARADDSVIAGVDPVSATDRASAITGTPPVGEPVPDQPTRRVPTRLPETGGPTIGLIWFGAGLLGAGLLVLRRSRHRRVRS